MKADNTDILKVFTPEHIEILDKIIRKFKGKPGGLIPALEEVQVALGYLPVSVQKMIGEELNVPISRVYGQILCIKRRRQSRVLLAGYNRGIKQRPGRLLLPPGNHVHAFQGADVQYWPSRFFPRLYGGYCHKPVGAFPHGYIPPRLSPHRP